ncbi:MAG: T9SS type A sorting domain-containing protein [Bacteroidales bacterium]|nr:T9SS type A sorting domain-containing protein [Bacteroidales bacterium]
MTNLKQICKITFLAVFFIQSAFTLCAADRYSLASGNWNSTSTWSASSGGPPGASVPVAGDNVYIENNHTITVTADAACANITFTANGAILSVNSSVVLSLSGTITLNISETGDVSCSISGAGSLSCKGIYVGPNAYTPVQTVTLNHTINSTLSSFTVSGNLTLNSYRTGPRVRNAYFNLSEGTLYVSGSITNPNGPPSKSYFSMETGAETATLILTGANPFNVGGPDIIELNGTSTLVNYNRSGAQTAYATDYNNMTLSGSGAKDVTGTNIDGILSMEGTATASGTTPTFGAASSLQYKGSAAQTTGIEFPATFAGTGGLIIDNSNGVTLNGGRTIDYALTFVNGILSTGLNNLTLSAGGTVSGAGAGRYVNGNFEKGIAAGTTTMTFEIGDASVFAPVALNFSDPITIAGTISCSTTAGDHPQIGSSDFNPSYTVNRYWTLINNGVGGYTTFDAIFNFVAGDIDTGTDYNYLYVGNYNAPSWTYPLTGTRTATSTEARGLTTFGDFQLGLLKALYRSAGTGNWEQSTSWEIFLGSSWVPAPSPPSAASNDITIISPHTVTNTSSLTIDELTVGPGAKLTMSADISVSDGPGTDMTINGTLDCGGSYIVSGDGSFSLGNAANIFIGSPEGITSSGTTGNIQTAIRTYDTGANYTYNGTLIQVTGNGLPSILNNLTIDNSSGAFLTGSVTVNGTLTLTDGPLVTGSTTLTFQNSDLPIARSTGTITTDASTIVFFGSPGNTGGAAFTIPSGTFTSSPTINSLTINRANTLTLGDQVISVYGILLCNGPLSTAGNLTLLSDASATALIDGSGTSQVSGNVTMQRYLSAAFGYKYFSSPFQAATVSEFGDDMDLTYWFPTFYEYDESRTSSGWVDYTDPAGVLESMTGYAANFGSGTDPLTVDVSGEVNNGALSLTLYNNNNTYTQGLNLVGNPYPSAINWDAASGWTKTNIDDAIYFFKTSATDEYGGTYSSYVNGIPSDGSVSSIIPSMQGFFIHVSDGSYPVTATLGMNNDVRVNDRSQAFFKSASGTKGNGQSKPLIRIVAAFEDDAENADPLVIYLHNMASGNFDSQLDALKILNTDFQVPNLYAMITGNRKLSINAIPDDFDSMQVIPLGLKTNRSGIIEFMLPDRDDYFDDKNIFLHDSITGIRQLLNNDSLYKINLESGEYHDRFFLEIGNISSGIEEPTLTDALFDIYSSNNLLKTNIYEVKGGEGILSVFNLTGQVVYRQIIRQAGYYEYRSPDHRGIYIVNYRTGERSSSKKIFIGN